MKWWPTKKEIDVLLPLDGYNRWAATYHQESNPIKTLSDGLIEKLLPSLGDKTVLDAGCGTGRFCSFAEKQHALKIVGLDLSPAMIEIARRRCPSVEFRCEDLYRSSIEEKFDVIICALVLAHLENIKPALDNLLSALSPGGVMIITDFHPFLTLLHSKRTFRDLTSGRLFEIRHYLHLFQEYVRCFAEHQTVVEALEEPWFNNAPSVFAMRVRKN